MTTLDTEPLDGVNYEEWRPGLYHSRMYYELHCFVIFLTNTCCVKGIETKKIRNGTTIDASK